MKPSELTRLVGAQLCVHAAMAGVRLAAPLMALSQGFSELAVGVLLSLFALTQVFLALPAGRFTDRHGLRRPMGLCVAAASTGAGLAALFPVFPIWCLAALLTGGATGVAAIALQRHVGRAATGSTQLKQVFSWLAIGPAIANFIGPFCAGLMIDYAGYRWAFALMAALPLTSWFLLRGHQELPSHVPPAGAARASVWDLMRAPTMRRLMLVNWFMSSCWDVHTFVVPVLGHERGLSASVIGSILGAFAVAAAVVRVLLPLIASRVREWAVILWAMVATALLFAVYPLMPSALAMGTCSVLLGLVLGTVQPMVMSTLHQITPPHRHGEALGLRLMMINASSVAMPMLFGAAGSVIGVAGLFWVVGGVVGLGARSAWQLRGVVLAPGEPH